MKEPIFSGVCTALVTPFVDNKINYPRLEQMLNYQIEHGIDAVVLSGTTGESPTLSDAEKIDIFRFAKETVAKKIPIIAGTGTNSTDHAIALGKAAQDVGADGLLVVSPYYNKGNPDGLYRHFLAIAESVKIPIILDNVPSRTGVDIPVTLYQKLSKIPNIVGVKEASSDITKITKIRAACGTDLHIWTGNDDQTVPVISLGGKGVISVLSNIAPKQTHDICAKFFEGDVEGSRKIQLDAIELIDALFCEVNPIPVKKAMNLMGLNAGILRRPLTEMEDANAAKLEKAMKVFPATPSGKVCMDIGASTGGFTDCMLQNGAVKVYSVDVGYGQLAWKLRQDERVVNMERTNIRYIDRERVVEPLEFFSVDVSFISLKPVLPVAYELLKEGGEGVCLIKPQFEAGREKVGKKGVVREKSTHIEVIEKVLEFTKEIGFSVKGLDFSPIKGPEGNIEYLMYIKKDDAESAEFDVADLVEQSHNLNIK